MRFGNVWTLLRFDESCAKYACEEAKSYYWTRATEELLKLSEHKFFGYYFFLNVFFYQTISKFCETQSALVRLARRFIVLLSSWNAPDKLNSRAIYAFDVKVCNNLYYHNSTGKEKEAEFAAPKGGKLADLDEEGIKEKVCYCLFILNLQIALKNNLENSALILLCCSLLLSSSDVHALEKN